MENKESVNISYRDPKTNKAIYVLDEEHLQQELYKAREEGRMETLIQIKKINNEIYEGRTEILEVEIDNMLFNLKTKEDEK